MKHTHSISFILLLAAIMSIGYYSVDLAKFISDKKNIETASISRTYDDDNNPIYLSETENRFDPMKIIDDTTDDTIDTSIKQLCSARIAAISKYYPSASFTVPVDNKLVQNLLYSTNGYIYVFGYEYFNEKGEKRLLDCIFDNIEYCIVYIRFYSPDEHEPTPEEISSAMNNLKNYSKDFYDNSEDLLSFVYNNVENIIIDYDENDWQEEPIQDYNEYYEKIFNIAEPYIFHPNNPVINFWFHSLIIDTVYIPDYLQFFSAGYLVEAISKASKYPESEYSVYKNCIYQKFNISNYNITVIYNINTNQVEGFFAPLTR